MSCLRDQVVILLESVRNEPTSTGAIPDDIGTYVDKLLDKAEIVAWHMQGRICGLVAFYANDPALEDAFITMVAVAPERRRGGIASALLGATLNSLAARGFACCRLEVSERNTPATRLYHSFGFEQVGADADVVTMRVALPRAGRSVGKPSRG